MATATKKCVGCKERGKNENMIQTPNKQWFCSHDCVAAYINKRFKKQKEVKQRQKDKVRLKELMTFTQWLSKLQKLVNQYVVYVKDKDYPCCTCGSHAEKMDAGHYKAVGRGGADRRRFNLFNIHAQCRHCNSFNSGKPLEYREFLINEYGVEKVEWLECEANHPTLKEQFPTHQDIEAEIVRYRALLRNNGITPNS